MGAREREEFSGPEPEGAGGMWRKTKGRMGGWTEGETKNERGEGGRGGAQNSRDRTGARRKGGRQTLRQRQRNTEKGRDQRESARTEKDRV